MATMVVTGPAPVELETTQSGPDFHQILAHDLDRRQLRQQAQHFAQLCGEIHADVQLVRELDPVIYLVDFDVIRNLIDMHPQDPEEQRQALRAFENPEFHYALPVGAFSELLWWLRGFAPSYRDWQPPVVEGDRREALRQMALAVNIWPDNPNEHELIREIASAAQRLSTVARVLLTFLDRPNFHAVYADYDESTRVALTEILCPLDRRDHEHSRDLRDLRDSQNLAVICKRTELRNQAADPHLPRSSLPESFVLLTQTSMLLDLVRRLEHRHDQDAIFTLSRLFKKEESGDSTEKILYSTGYPVMTPLRAFFVEELRTGGIFSDDARAMIEDVRIKLQRLSTALEEPTVPYTHLSTAVQIKREADLRTCVQDLNDYHTDSYVRMLFVDRILSGGTPPHPALPSKTRALNPLSERSAAFSLTESSVEYFYRSLVALNRKLDNIAPTEYQIDSAPHPSGTFLRLIVTSRHPEEKVMRGELYVDEIDGLDTPVAYSFRWQTVASETRFFASLQSIFSLAPDIVHSTLPPVLAVRSITGDEPPPTEGLLYFTNIGVFSVPLKETFLSLTRGGRIAERLKQTMADTSRTLADKIEIQAVRLQTDFGDFQLDIANDDAGIREVFVITRHNIAEQIANLCESTSLLGVFPKRLNLVLQPITSLFPRYSRNDLTRTSS